MSEPAHPRTLTRQVALAAVILAVLQAAVFGLLISAGTQRATAAAIPGVGLGLTIAQAIVHGHEGRLAVQSSEGEGTTFRIDLPLHRTAEVRA